MEVRCLLAGLVFDRCRFGESSENPLWFLDEGLSHGVYFRYIVFFFDMSLFCGSSSSSGRSSVVPTLFLNKNLVVS